MADVAPAPDLKLASTWIGYRSKGIQARELVYEKSRIPCLPSAVLSKVSPYLGSELLQSFLNLTLILFLQFCD